MLVQSVPGSRCPKEGKPREYITDQTPEDVPDSAYYLRLVADGSLIPVSPVIPAVDALQGIQAEIQDSGKKRGGK
jgi:hypothetical protein